MRLKIERTWCSPNSTIGKLSVDGKFECYSLEDVVREDGRIVQAWKIPGCTAIPTGSYSVIVTPSQRFKRDLPLLVDVPGFTGVRIHPGNGPKDTEGCILVGASKDTDFVGHSREAFEKLFTKIQESLGCGEKVTLEVV